MKNEKLNWHLMRKIITGILLYGFIIIGMIDGLKHNQPSYSSIMGMNIKRVYFYTFYLLITGCWLLYNKFIVGIGFITLATFNSYFLEYVLLHNYFASIMIYVGLVIDILVSRKYLWIIPFAVLGLIQATAFLSPSINHYIVGLMEFLSLCIGSAFIVKQI